MALATERTWRHDVLARECQHVHCRLCTTSRNTCTTSRNTCTTSHDTCTTSHDTCTTSHDTCTTSHDTCTTSHDTCTTSHDTCTTSHDTCAGHAGITHRDLSFYFRYTLQVRCKSGKIIRFDCIYKKYISAVFALFLH